MSKSWVRCADSLPGEGVVVHTKIDDEKGRRNETMLKRQGRLWFFLDDSMYVYYTPTHWADTAEKKPVALSEAPEPEHPRAELIARCNRGAELLRRESPPKYPATADDLDDAADALSEDASTIKSLREEVERQEEVITRWQKNYDEMRQERDDHALRRKHPFKECECP